MINYKRLNDLERECVHTYGGFPASMPKNEIPIKIKERVGISGLLSVPSWLF